MASKRKPVTDEGIGALIRAQREKSGMSQVELGDHVGVGPMQISKYETGISSISAVKLVKIAEALKCKTLDLLP